MASLDVSTFGDFSPEESNRCKKEQSLRKTMRNIFMQSPKPQKVLNAGISVLGEKSCAQCPEYALLGSIEPLNDDGADKFATDDVDDGDDDEEDDDGVEGVYLNTHEPFCMVAIGVQGAGKSHTMTCALESCLIKLDPIIKLQRPQLTLVLHYDEGDTTLCESMGLLKQSEYMKIQFGNIPSLSSSSLHVPQEKAVMLVSPAFYKQRQRFYSNLYGNACEVRPLLFHWRSLSADHIKKIMRIQDGDNQLYVAALFNLLRRYQSKEIIPNFEEFIEKVKEVCNVRGQDGPLSQRLNLLESLVAESKQNKNISKVGGNLQQCCEPGKLILVDLTDNLLSKEEANGIFQVIVEQYQSLNIQKGGKVLALDEAHKYMNGSQDDGLSRALVDTARLMRHNGMRLIVSTQSPLALAPELLELVSVAFLHRFHSIDWFDYLKKKLPLKNNIWHHLNKLDPGSAIMFTTRHRLPNHFSLEYQVAADDDEEGSGERSGNLFKVSIRPRITADYGSSKTNTLAANLS